MGRGAVGVRGMRLKAGDYIVGMATTPKPGEGNEPKKRIAGAPEAAEDLLPEKGSLILSVTEGGYGKRTTADSYRLTGRGMQGVTHRKTTEQDRSDSFWSRHSWYL